MIAYSEDFRTEVQQLVTVDLPVLQLIKIKMSTKDTWQHDTLYDYQTFLNKSIQV